MLDSVLKPHDNCDKKSRIESVVSHTHTVFERGLNLIDSQIQGAGTIGVRALPTSGMLRVGLGLLGRATGRSAEAEGFTARLNALPPKGTNPRSLLAAVKQRFRPPFRSIRNKEFSIHINH